MQEEILNIKNQAVGRIMDAKTPEDLDLIQTEYLGRNGYLTQEIKNISKLQKDDRKGAGIIINEAKKLVLDMIVSRKNQLKDSSKEWFDKTIPGVKPPIGHLHLVTQAITEIADVFEKIGFVRVRYPEVEWDYYAYATLNFPEIHPARDDLETFFVDSPSDKKMGKMLLSPHTSSGQVREMYRVNPATAGPIRMVNIAKCYRRQSDISHTQMFHQFEGLVIDQNISVINLKGTLDYFAKNFFGESRKTRLRPYNFRFTEPSFEVDITCDNCNGQGCRLCKAGWLELGGAGMVHPNVLKSGGIDSKKYSGFAFGWGVERAIMMKSGVNIPDLRLLYSPDLRFLSQF